MSLSLKDIGGNLNVIDFKISNISEPILSADFTQATLTLTGVADPENTAVDLITYEYSTDNGITWDTMTTESLVTGLTFSPTGENIYFTWDIKTDLGNSIYNTTIKIRFRAQANFEPLPTTTTTTVAPTTAEPTTSTTTSTTTTTTTEDPGP